MGKGFLRSGMLVAKKYAGSATVGSAAAGIPGVLPASGDVEIVGMPGVLPVPAAGDVDALRR